MPRRTKAITVAGRLGTLRLPRQVLRHRENGTHVMPGDAVLPPHGGMVITRALQELGCLLAQDVPFASAARLHGWQTREERMLMPSTLRTLVRRHGKLVRAAEYAAVDALTDPASGGLALAPLVPNATPCR